MRDIIALNAKQGKSEGRALDRKEAWFRVGLPPDRAGSSPLLNKWKGAVTTRLLG
jgi:hypothetical protein